MIRFGSAVLPLLMLGLLSTACVPQVPLDPLAVRVGAAGELEILDTECRMQSLVRVEMIRPGEGQMLDDDDPRIWRLDLDPPSRERSFVVGASASGGREVVSWTRPPADVLLIALLVTERDMKFKAEFTLNDLAADKVWYHSKSMTPEDFAQKSAC